jgi:hypothetical protein
LKTYAATFREIKKSENYVGATFLTPCLGVQYVVKTPFAAFPLRCFPRNMGAVSDEHFEKFHQDISQMEKKRYSGK